MSVSKIEKIIEEKEKQGIVAFGGKVDGNVRYGQESCQKVTIGCLTFYIEENCYLGKVIDAKVIGWESTEPINHIEMPTTEVFMTFDEEMLESTGIESVTLSRKTKHSIFPWSWKHAKKIIIPKETKRFEVKNFVRMKELREIEFEDPCGWGVSKKIINDPSKMREYLIEIGEGRNYPTILEKTFLNKIRYWLGL